MVSPVVIGTITASCNEATSRLLACYNTPRTQGLTLIPEIRFQSLRMLQGVDKHPAVLREKKATINIYNIDIYW